MGIGLNKYFGKPNFFKNFFSFYYNKIHSVTNYKSINNKINKTRQHRTKNVLTNKTTTTATTTTKRKQDEITCSRPLPFSF